MIYVGFASAYDPTQVGLNLHSPVLLRTLVKTYKTKVNSKIKSFFWKEIF